MSTPALTLYLALARLGGPLAPRLLARRAAKGKEEPARMREKLGEAALARPAGPLAWFHAASVGESLSVLGLIEEMRAARPDVSVLVTTGTLTSAKLMATRLPAGCRHQFAPLDLGRAPRRFVEHWRPDLCVWVESEIWPALVEAAGRSGAPMALVNARMSEASARGWARAPGMIAHLLRRFSAVLAQDADGAARLRRLGAEGARASGSLKAGAAPPDRPNLRKAALAALRGRPVWLAASTHEGEEMEVAEAQRVAAARVPGLVCLLVPRHPERGEAIARELWSRSLRVARRGRGQAIGPQDEIHVADTLGEMGAWLRLAPVAFIGGSLVDRGGHNPHEPTALGAAILHGPHVGNFRADYAALAAAGGARQVADGVALGEAVADLLSDPAARERMVDAARAALGDGRGATEATLEALLPLLPQRVEAPSPWALAPRPPDADPDAEAAPGAAR
ncbi:3-deoxy-D-manno-octulosonic acid transferase [Albimonas pacifica]|uniref:3-deoxy-D-manno-octulosonic acid transferase n=1 Tax=Albimonas pacifica TaxID=1114924 RepID=A0A1I3D8Q4_9RHOB|nr:3-deoxy-D-manno-octulosonic acid transferase [Albimonas pacifica]SFH83124.1 3-deoxy-D-manno-octulosonic-acid transferase [Albimonas pacifica]